MNQLLFYQNIVALDRKKHQSLSLTTPISLDFAAGANFIPILLTELSEVTQELPVLFVPIGESEFALAAITGVQKESNLLIRNGSWLGRYVPAFLRRYPFITLGNPSDTSQFTIAIDDQAQCLKGASLAGLPAQKHPLFEKDKPGKKLEELIPFLQKFHLDNQQTYAFCKRLQELNLLVKSDLGVQDKQGKKYQVNGGWLIDEAALKALDPKLIQEFFVSDWLQKIYQIQFSIKNFPLMIDHFTVGNVATSKSLPQKLPKTAAAPVAQKAIAPKVVPKKTQTASKPVPTKKVVAAKKTVALKSKAVAKKAGKK
jgi:hypothetical protein